MVFAVWELLDILGPKATEDHLTNPQSSSLQASENDNTNNGTVQESSHTTDAEVIPPPAHSSGCPTQDDLPSESCDDIYSANDYCDSEESYNQLINDKKIYKYISIVNNGIYKFKFTKQRQIGGLSLPIVTTVWVGNDYISIIETEMHNIATEIFINSEGAYLLDIHNCTADLISIDDVKIPTPNISSLLYVTEGITSIGDSQYFYERYETAEGKVIDYLFIDEELRKAKVYTDIDDYEIITIEITADISDGRTKLPNGLTITDRR